MSDPEELEIAKSIAIPGHDFDVNFDMDGSTAAELMEQFLMIPGILQAFNDNDPEQECRQAFERLGFVFDEGENRISWDEDKCEID